MFGTQVSLSKDFRIYRIPIPLYLPLFKRENSGFPPLSKGRLGGDGSSFIANLSSNFKELEEVRGR